MVHSLETHCGGTKASVLSAFCVSFTGFRWQHEIRTTTVTSSNLSPPHVQTQATGLIRPLRQLAVPSTAARVTLKNQHGCRQGKSSQGHINQEAIKEERDHVFWEFRV